MKPYLLLFLLCGAYTVSFSQNNLTAVETWEENDFGVLEPVRKISYEYDIFDNLILESNFEWEDAFKVFAKKRTIERTFDNENRILSYRDASFPDEEKGFKRLVEYAYNDTCLDQEIEQVLFNENLESKTISFYNQTTCKVDSAWIYALIYSDPLDEIGRVKYFSYQDNEELQVYFMRDILTGEFSIPFDTTHIIRNEQGLMTRFYSSVSDIGEELYTYEYDEFGNRTLETVYFPFYLSGFEIIKEILREYIYNEDNQILEVRASYLDYQSIPSPVEYSRVVIEYEYNCDGLLSKKTTTNTRSVTVQFYQYENGHNCELQNDVDLLTVRPSITTDYILVESEILQTEGTYIMVYDMSGRKVKEIQPNRVHHYQLDIGNLPTGEYIIRVFNENYNETERITKI